MRHVSGVLSRVFAVICLAAAVPFAALAQDATPAPAPSLVQYALANKSTIVLVVCGLASLIAHFVPPTTPTGKFVSWLAGNFGKALTSSKVGLMAIGFVLCLATAAHAQDAHVPGTPTPAAADPIATYAPTAGGAVFTVGGTLLAQADTTPAPTAPVAAPAPAPTSTPAPVAAPSDPTPVIGGCFANGKWCVGPTVALTLTAINLTTQHVEAGFNPGVGVGLTYQKGTWNSIGLGAFFNLTPGASGVPDNASGAAILSFLNGYGRVGLSKGFIGDKSTRLLVGTGLDL